MLENVSPLCLSGAKWALIDALALLWLSHTLNRRALFVVVIIGVDVVGVLSIVVVVVVGVRMNEKK